MHPRLVLALCERIGPDADATDAPFIGTVKALCHMLLQQPVQPVRGPIQPPELGKLYERIVALALACRVAACDRRGRVTVGQLLYGGGPTCMTGLADVSVCVGIGGG